MIEDRFIRSKPIIIYAKDLLIDTLKEETYTINDVGVINFKYKMTMDKKIEYLDNSKNNYCIKRENKEKIFEVIKKDKIKDENDNDKFISNRIENTFQKNSPSKKIANINSKYFDNLLINADNIFNLGKDNKINIGNKMSSNLLNTSKNQKNLKLIDLSNQSNQAYNNKVCINLKKQNNIFTRNSNQNVKINQIPSIGNNNKDKNIYSLQYTSTSESKCNNTNTEIFNADNSFELIECLSTNKIENKLSDLYTLSIAPGNLISNNDYDNFCIGIFITGLSPFTGNNAIIKNSEDFLAPCGHKECSIFPSVLPDLLHLYLNKSNPNKFIPDINSIVSNSCFPLGIKPCYNYTFSKGKRTQTRPNPQQIFFNKFKNEKNEIFYTSTLIYFVQISKKEFEANYKFNSIKNYIDSSLSDKKRNINDKSFKILFETISKLLLNDSVLLPESLTLISRYPYYFQMDTVLKTLINLPKKEMNLLINNIINEIPIPCINTKIQFYVPRTKYLLNLESIQNSERNISYINCTSFLKMNIEIIILIFHLILLEQKILLVDNNYKILTEISFLFINFIYPLDWVNPYVPLLSYSSVNLLQTFIPFIMGIDEYLLNYSFKNGLLKGENDNVVSIFYLSKNYFCTNKDNKKMTKKELLKELNIPDLPEKVYKILYKSLKDIQIKFDKDKKIINNDEFYSMLRDTFLKAMIILIGDYKNFTFFTNEEMPLFNKEAFLSTHDKDLKMFLSELVSTQNFYQLLFNEKNKNKEDDKNINYSYINMKYFHEKLADYSELINTQIVRKRSNSNFSKKPINRMIGQKKLSRRNSKIDNNKYLLNHINSSFHKSKEKNLINKNNSYCMSSRNSSTTKNKNQMVNIKIHNPSSSINQNESISNASTLQNKEDTNKKSTKKLKTYLLFPYFIPKSEIYNTNTKKIDKKILENYITSYLSTRKIRDVNSNEQHCYIISNQKEYKFDRIKPLTQRYFAFILNKDDKVKVDFNKEQPNIQPKEEMKTIDTSFKYNDILKKPLQFQKSFKSFSNLNSTSSSQKNDPYSVNTSNTLSHFYDQSSKSDIQFISECFKNICTSKQKLQQNNFEKLDKLLKNRNNKIYLTNLIIPDENISNEENHKQLSSSNYNDFLRLVRNILNNLTNEDFDIGRLLTLACFSYCKIEKGDVIIYIYEDLIKGAYPCNLWNNDLFWVNFFTKEIERDKTIENEEEENNNIEEGIRTTVDIMIKLQINKNKIKSIVYCNILGKYSISKENLDEINEVFLIK